MNLNKYVTQWDSDNIMENVDNVVSTIMYLIILVTLLVPAFIGGDFSKVFSTSTSSIFLIGMILFTIPLQFILKGKDKKYSGYGKSSNASIAVVVALFLGIMFFMSPNMSISSGTYSLLPGYDELDILQIFQNSIAAPYVEETFFSLTLPFILVGLFKYIFKENYSLPLILTICLMFAGMHALAYNANIQLMAFAFIFRLIVIIGNGELRSGLFGIGLHEMNNIANGLRTIKSIVTI